MVVPARNYVADMDAPLLQLSPQGDFFSQRQSFSGTHYWGLIGGGKTTSAKMQACAFLRAGYGGHISCVKYDELELWIKYCEQHGRSNSLFLFDDGQAFNFLDYQMALQGLDGINTTVEAIMTVVEATRLGSGGSNRGGDAFWSDSPRVPLRNCLPIIYAATGSLTIPDTLRFIATGPQSPQEVTSREWQARSFMYQLMNRAVNAPKVRIPPASLGHIVNFWSEQWASAPSKTTGNIVMTLTAALDRFNHGRLNRVFCGKTTVVPEMAFGGAIIVDAKPTLTWNEDGIIAQRLFKFFFQRSVLSRNSLAPQYRERPLFMWGDEGQETVLPTDGDFLGLCRQSKCAVVNLSQSIPAYVSRIGGDNPRDAALSLAGKFGNHVFCSNSDPETNEFASKMLGRVITRHGNYSSGHAQNFNIGMSAGSSQSSGDSSSYSMSPGMAGSTGNNSSNGSNWGDSRGRGNSDSVNRGYSESLEYAIEPGDFARYLKTGGPQNGNRVSAVWFQTARVFRATGTNFLIPEFEQ